MNFFDKYLLLNLKDYGLAYDFYINIVVIAIFTGLCVACFIINKNQASVALILRKLIRAEAIGERNGRTLSSLGLCDSKAVKKLLSSTSGYMKGIITYVGAKTPSYEEYLASERAKKEKNKKKSGESSDNKEKISDLELTPDFSSALFYIPEDKKENAERAFIKNNGSLTKTVLSCLALLGFTIILVLLMPTIVRTLKGLLAV